ncbi:MAG TPA: cytochrome P450 [Telluria sp.]|nr:cytochrome P450 [Telluria sp.]
MQPTNPVAAATHANPYPYYRDLLKGPALHFDPVLKLWVASRAAVIREVFGNPQCLVRPAGEPVPAAIAGSAAGEVFSLLMRMNEGAAHAGPRRVIGQALSAIEPERIRAAARQCAAMLGGRHDLSDGAGLTGWTFDLPTHVVAHLLGFGQGELPSVARWVADFVRSLSPLSTAEQLAEASVAAESLMLRCSELIRANAQDGETLLGEIRRGAEVAGWDSKRAILANLVGLLSQTHEATAGLIGNGIVALLRDPDLQARLRADPALASAFVHEVARHDPPVQNTRRFVSAPATVAGVPLKAGETILLLLAAAGRDPKVHHEPDAFMLDRPQWELAGFGRGRHGCPGQAIAHTIAVQAIRHLLSEGALLDPSVLTWSYRPSANGRLPIFSSAMTRELQ